MTAGTEPLPDRAPDGARLLAALNQRGVDFVVIGGMAGHVHGAPFATYDLDVAYDRSQANLRRMVAALGDIGVTLRVGGHDAGEPLPFVLEERTLANGANFTFNTPFGAFDILGDIAGVDYDSLRRDALVDVLFGEEVRVASIDHLVSMKRASNRPKDRIMLETYLVIAEEQARMRKEEGL